MAKQWQLPRSLLTKLRAIDLTSALGRQYRPRRRSTKGTGRLAAARDMTVDRALATLEALEPDAAWQFYMTLPAPLQEAVAQLVSPTRWSELFLRELEAKALARDEQPDAWVQPFIDNLNRNVRNNVPTN